MDPETQKLLKEQFEKLPRELQVAIHSSQTQDQIRAIGGKHNLHIDQLAQLEDETMLLMMGFSSPNEFMTRLADAFHMESAEVVNLAAEIGNQILEPIRNSLKNPPKIALTNSPSPVDSHPADVMLSEKTVSVAPTPAVSTLAGAVQQATAAPKSAVPAKTEPPTPKPYTADPYREPI